MTITDKEKFAEIVSDFSRTGVLDKDDIRALIDIVSSLNIENEMIFNNWQKSESTLRYMEQRVVELKAEIKRLNIPPIPKTKVKA